MSTDTTTFCRDTLATTMYDEPYAALRDRRLAARLAAEDVAEEAGLDPFERISCRLHQRWLHQCVSSPVHVVAWEQEAWLREVGSGGFRRRLCFVGDCRGSPMFDPFSKPKHRQLLGGAVCSNPTGSSMSGNQKSFCAISPAT